MLLFLLALRRRPRLYFILIGCAAKLLAADADDRCCRLSVDHYFVHGGSAVWFLENNNLDAIISRQQTSSLWRSLLVYHHRHEYNRQQTKRQKSFGRK